jgi:hypothetical protein
MVVPGLVVLPGTPATADPQDGRCEDNELCVFKDANAGGCVFDLFYDGTVEGGLEQDYASCKGQKMKDSISSYQNRSPAWLMMWEHPDKKGFLYCVVPRGSGNVLKSFNDKASSLAAADPEDFANFGGERKCNFVDRD